MSNALPSSVILDGDGVLWHEKQVDPGLAEFMATLTALDIRWILATNNARFRPGYHAETLRRFGADCDESHVITSPEVAADLICRDTAGQVRVCMIGEDGLEHALRSRGARIINDQWKAEHGWAEPPTHVVTGFTMDMAYQHLAAAHSGIVDHGAQFLVTNPDRKARNAQGVSFPANGGTMAFLRHSTGRDPIVCGKPEPAMFEEAMRRMGADPRGTVVIGDTPETEILGGNRMGLETWMVMGGSTPTLEGIPPEAYPKKQFADISAITAYLRKIAG